MSDSGDFAQPRFDPLTDNLLDAIRVLETAEVVEVRDAAEAERAAVAIVRAESATETRARKAAGWKFVEDIAPLPRRASPIETEHDEDDEGKPARVRKTRDFPTLLADAKKVAGELDPGVRRYAAGALMQTLRRRDWDAAKIEKTIDTIFPTTPSCAGSLHTGRSPPSEPSSSHG